MFEVTAGHRTQRRSVFSVLELHMQSVFCHINVNLDLNEGVSIFFKTQDAGCKINQISQIISYGLIDLSETCYYIIITTHKKDSNLSKKKL